MDFEGDAMSLDINNLASQGAFAPVEITEEQVTFNNGAEDVTLTVCIRPLSYKTALSEIKASQESQDALAARIAASICDAEGKPVFTVGDITGDSDPERGPLNSNLTMALLSAIGKASGLGKSKSRSATKTSSGTS